MALPSFRFRVGRPSRRVRRSPAKSCDARVVVRNIKTLEFRNDPFSRLGLLEGQLGMLVEPSPQCGKARTQRLTGLVQCLCDARLGICVHAGTSIPPSAIT
jgi:hypothetical protein